jgi:hypothetical protein
MLGETLYRQGRLDDAELWAAVSRANTASGDRATQLLLLPVEAKLRCSQGSLPDARELAEKAARLADDTDGLNVIASTRLALAEVQRIAGLDDDADISIREAIALFERKENAVGASQALMLLGREVPA